MFVCIYSFFTPYYQLRLSLIVFILYGFIYPQSKNAIQYMYVFKHPIKKDQSEGNMTSKSKSRLILALSRSTIYNKHNNIVSGSTQYEIYFYFYISHLYKIIKYPDDLTKTSPYPYRFIRIDHNLIHATIHLYAVFSHTINL